MPTRRVVGRAVTRKFWKVSELAKLLGLSMSTIQHYIKKGHIKAIKVGGIWLIPDDEVRRLLGEYYHRLGEGEGGKP